MMKIDQLFIQLSIKLIKNGLPGHILTGLPDQMGIVIQADEAFNYTKYVMFHDGNRMSLKDLEDQNIEEFSTVSYGDVH